MLSAGPLKEYGIRDGDMLLLQRVQGERGQPMAGRQLSSSVPSQSSSGQYPVVFVRHVSRSCGLNLCIRLSHSAYPNPFTFQPNPRTK